MSNVLNSIAVSGLVATQQRMGASAQNIANVETKGYRRQQAAQSTTSSGGVTATISSEAVAQSGDELATDLIDQKSAAYEFKANLQVLKTGDRMMGSLLDIRA